MRTILSLTMGLLVLPALAQADTVSPAVGRPLQQAERLITARNYPAALAALQQAAHVTPLTPFERAAIAQLHGTAEAGAGHYTQAAADYQAALASGTVPPASRLPFIQAIAGFYDEAGDNAQTITWVNRYIAAGGADARTEALLPQAYYNEGDNADAEHALQEQQSTGAALSVPELQLLASSAEKSGDQAGYFAALCDLLQSAPTPATWNAAIATVTARPDFSDTLTLDVYRLRRATQTLTAPGGYEDYAERAIIAGEIPEARDVLEAGFSNEILNQTTDNGHAARLKTLAESNAAPSSDPAPADPLAAAIAQYQAGQPGLAADNFTKLATAPGNSARAALAKLWAIRAQDAAHGTK